MRIKDVRRLKTPFDVLVYWITERENIRRKRALGLPPPWTDDEILKRFRFCNVRRMDDKVSLWLLNNWYKPYKDHPNILSAVALARFVNNPRCLETIGHAVLRIDEKPPDWKMVEKILRTRKKEGTVFNAAYMVRGAKTGGDKIREVVHDYVRPLSKDPDQYINVASMEETWKRLVAAYGFGSFMAGQVTADLRWAMTGTWRDRRKWAPLGPGSLKGMNFLLGRPEEQRMGQGEFLEHLLELIKSLKQRLPVDLTKRLEAMDYQNCCCEISKYSRTLAGRGKPKQNYQTGV